MAENIPEHLYLQAVQNDPDNPLRNLLQHAINVDGNRTGNAFDELFWTVATLGEVAVDRPTWINDVAATVDQIIVELSNNPNIKAEQLPSIVNTLIEGLYTGYLSDYEPYEGMPLPPQWAKRYADQMYVMDQLQELRKKYSTDT